MIKKLKAFFTINIRNKSFADFDKVLFLSVVAVSIFGLIVLSSAAHSLEDSAHIMKSQIMATALGFFLIIFLTFVDYEIWGKFYILIYAVCILLLVWTYFYGVEDNWGARSWVKLGSSFSFQPSELVKVGLIISLAKVIEKNKENLNEPFTLIKVLIFAFFPVGLILLQPDLGTAIVFTFFIAVMLFCAGLKWSYVFYAGLLLVVAIPLIWNKLDDYQKKRFFSFLDPNHDALASSYQTLQSKIALASGELTGRGLYKGVQTQFKYLPTKETDYIFSALSEELGFLGGIFLISLYLILLLRLIDIARKHHLTFGSFICMGFFGMFFFHIAENIGMNVGILPATGIPLPFVSQGGTFQLISLATIGLALSVSIHEESPDFELEKHTLVLEKKEQE